MTKSSEDLIEEYSLFLQMDDWKRFDEIKNILDFYTAGETNNKMLLFFLLLGDLHDDLKSFKLYRGDPGAGKNIISNTVLKLFPQKKVYVLDGATAKALNYDNKIKEADIIYLRELERHESVIEILKGLYNADGRIFKETIQDKDSKAHYVKHHETKRKGVITTFSFETIKSDIISRSWILMPDQTYDQTSKIIDFDINYEKNLIEKKLQKKEMDNRCFFISQCILTLNFDYIIYIPYIDKLEVLLPYTHLNVRRDKTKLFNLIKIITLWNQENRKSITIDNETYLIAEYIDLKMALQISQDLFINLVLHLDDTKRSILDYMVDIEMIAKTKTQENITSFCQVNKTIEIENIEKEKKYTITEIYEEINTDLSISRRTIQRKLNDLFYEGYLLREKEGNKYYYSKLRGYDLINTLDLNNIKEEINSIVEQTYIYYSNKTREILDDKIS